MILGEIDATQALAFNTSSLLVVTVTGELRRLFCPFKVTNSSKLNQLTYGHEYDVQAIRISKEGVLVYYVLGKPYYYFNFSIQ
jgi:hypothetical protein